MKPRTIALITVGATILLGLFVFDLLPLPFRKSGAPKKETQPLISPTPTIPPTFTPTFNPESQKGPLVSSFTVSYTLVGKVTNITPAKTAGKYTIEITSRNGAQKYTMTDIGGEGILTTTNKTKKISWEELKPGDDVIVDLSVSPDKETGKSTVFIGQIAVLSR